MARGGPREAQPGFVQTRPSEHAQQQYEGLFRGLGVTCKETICSKRPTLTGRIHGATHFAIGCKKWDDADNRSVSAAHREYTDPQVVYATCDAPDKNASVVELRQRAFDPEVHYRTEQRERFVDAGPQPLDDPYSHISTVHLGDDKPEKITNTAATHFRPASPEAQRAAAFRCAGSGTLIPTNPWPQPHRCNPITGGPRHPDTRDMGEMNKMNFNRISKNYTTIIHDMPNVRDPIIGVHLPYDHPRYGAPDGIAKTEHTVARANADVPYLRSLGALRPHDERR